MKKVILAYSGGLDTSIILKWLVLQNYEVIAFIADVGQAEDFAAISQKALRCGASKTHVMDLKTDFVEHYVMPAISAGVIYEDRYLMGTSLARPAIAKKQIELAKAEGAAYVAHGATGKGNDQVRFELSYHALSPEISVIAPWRDPQFIAQFKGRTDLLDFAKAHNIPVSATHKKPYSTDANLVHISYEAGILEDTDRSPPKDLFLWTRDPKDAPDTPCTLEIHFQQGMPVTVKNLDTQTTISGPLAILNYCNDIASQHGIGRLDIVENRYVGIKSRGVYETPGVTLLWTAHQDLETLTMDKAIFRIKQSLIPQMADCIYNGYWHSPEMSFLLKIMAISQKTVSGVVRVELYKGNITIKGRSSSVALYDSALSSMDEIGGYSPEDATGFIGICGLRLKMDRLTQSSVRTNDAENREDA